jgi:phosphatidylserine/phosphatidylglycerophosphate/cardiolipin synthase-like enzyme
MSHRRHPRLIACPLRLIGLRVVTTATLAGSPESGPTVTVGFTPGGACTDAIVKLLGEATSSLLVQV